MKILKLFIASSNEVKEERDRVIIVINHLNESFPNLDLKVVEWEYKMVSGSQPGFENIQTAINPELDSSDIVIFLFYGKIGRFTAEEYEYAIKANKKLLLFLKQGILLKTSRK